MIKKASSHDTACLWLITVSTVICFITLAGCSTYTDINTSVNVSTSFSGQTEDSDVSADPDGYLNGKWNLWEFVGDFFSGMIE